MNVGDEQKLKKAHDINACNLNLLEITSAEQQQQHSIKNMVWPSASPTSAIDCDLLFQQ